MADGYLLPNPEQYRNTSRQGRALNRQEARCLARLSTQLETLLGPVFKIAITRSRWPKISSIDSTPYAGAMSRPFAEVLAETPPAQGSEKRSAHHPRQHYPQQGRGDAGWPEAIFTDAHDPPSSRVVTPRLAELC